MGARTNPPKLWAGCWKEGLVGCPISHHFVTASKESINSQICWIVNAVCFISSNRFFQSIIKSEDSRLYNLLSLCVSVCLTACLPACLLVSMDGWMNVCMSGNSFSQDPALGFF